MKDVIKTLRHVDEALELAIDAVNQGDTLVVRALLASAIAEIESLNERKQSKQRNRPNVPTKKAKTTLHPELD